MAHHKAILLLSILILLAVSSALVPLSQFPAGPFHIILQILKGFLLASAWLFFYFFIKVAVFDRYKHAYRKEIPRIVYFTTKFLIFVCAVLSIIVFVLGQSVLSIVALGGLVGAGLTFALGELILDGFAGVILETESPFDIDDWIKLQDGIEGRLIKVNWRTVILLTQNEHLVVVPHRKLAQGFTNYSKPKRHYWDSTEISLDHTVPIERAARILRAGAMVAPGVHQGRCEVMAVKANKSGITYEVNYMVPDVSVSGQVKHDVIDSITRHLHKYDLRVSEVIGEYAISKGGKPFKEESPLTVAHLLKKVDVFTSLPKSTITNLSENANRLVFREGEKIVTEGEEGQSMFLVGEGLVEVSITYKDNDGHKKEKKLFHLGFPEYFGEMALLLNEKRSATVKALMNTVVYEISQSTLKLALKDHPKVFEKLATQAMAKREKNRLTKAQLEEMKEKKAVPSKGLLTQFKKFFK